MQKNKVQRESQHFPKFLLQCHEICMNFSFHLYICLSVTYLYSLLNSTGVQRKRPKKKGKTQLDPCIKCDWRHNVWSLVLGETVDCLTYLTIAISSVSSPCLIGLTLSDFRSFQYETLVTAEGNDVWKSCLTPKQGSVLRN